MQTGINTEIYSSIQDIARVTPDLKLADREGMCRAIATLCELGMRLEEQERANGGGFDSMLVHTQMRTTR